MSLISLFLSVCVVVVNSFVAYTMVKKGISRISPVALFFITGSFTICYLGLFGTPITVVSACVSLAGGIVTTLLVAQLGMIAEVNP